MNDADYSYLKKTILTLLDVNLDYYKDQQMRRRLEGFMSRARAAGVVPYCKLLRASRESLHQLQDFLTINVSEFFRDAEPFRQLRTEILPKLLLHSPRLSILSAGCSHGAEPYSLAIILADLSPGQRHRIVATDIDERILNRARAGGPYTTADVKGVSKALLLKYFSQTDDGYWVNEQIKRSVTFKRHNLHSDPLETGFDLVICRNVVIYFEEEAKRRLYEKLRRALKSNGVLFIGGTETLLEAESLGLERISNCFFRNGAARTARPQPGRVPVPLAVK